jgi:hypothetical protein
MSGLPETRNDFNGKPTFSLTDTRSKSAPFSIRLLPAERERLAAEAGSLPLSTYIRAKLLGQKPLSPAAPV